MTKRVITSVLLHSPEDLAEYRAACEILQRVTERHLKPEVWEFVRDGEPEIFFRGLRMVRSAI